MNYDVMREKSTVAAPHIRMAPGWPSASVGTYPFGAQSMGSVDHVVGRAVRAQPISKAIVYEEFRKHKRKWRKETQYYSSLTDKYLHPSYARIIGMGYPVVSIILQSLKQQPNDWFYALRAITAANPVKTADSGNMIRMTEAWLDWGRKRGLCD